MDRQYKRWIFTKTTYFAPTGALQLGQILYDSFDPDTTLHQTLKSRMTFDAEQLKTDFYLEIESTELKDLELSQSSEMSRHFGFANGKVEEGRSESHSLVLKFDNIETKILSPSVEYVEAALTRGDVPRKLAQIRDSELADKPKRSWLPFHGGGGGAKKDLKKKNPQLFIVTGVRAVHGARMVRKDAEESTSESSASASANTGAALTATTGAPPIGAGAGVEKSRQAKETREESFGSASSFVFAYRLSEIYYASKAVQYKPFVQGETASLPEGREHRSMTPLDSPVAQVSNDTLDVEVLRVEDEDFGGEDDDELVKAGGFRERKLEGFDEVVCLVPSEYEAQVGEEESA